MPQMSERKPCQCGDPTAPGVHRRVGAAVDGCSGPIRDVDGSPALSQQPKPGWQRWRIRRDFVAQGNKWDITHDCGWSARVDIGDNPHAIVEAELAHEQDCR